jgi:hypothetical protein
MSVVKRYRIKPIAVFLPEEGMIIDTEKRLIRKYNESACRVIELLAHAAISLGELRAGLTDATGRPVVHPKDLAEFIEYMDSVDILEITDSVE